MIVNKKIVIMTTVLFSMSTLTGFGLKDISKDLKPDTEKCDGAKNEKDCKNKEMLKTGANIAAIGLSAKLVVDMAVDYNTQRTTNEIDVERTYIEKYKILPEVPTVVSYNASLAPSNVAQIGKEVTVKTTLTVVPSRNQRQALIEEKISIYDNEDNSKVIKSLVKKVNDKTKALGTYENQFAFTLPAGMPQGVYPIDTAVIVDGKEQPSKPNKMQVVLQVLENNQIQVAYL